MDCEDVVMASGEDNVGSWGSCKSDPVRCIAGDCGTEFVADDEGDPGGALGSNANKADNAPFVGSSTTGTTLVLLRCMFCCKIITTRQAAFLDGPTPLTTKPLSSHQDGRTWSTVNVWTNDESSNRKNEQAGYSTLWARARAAHGALVGLCDPFQQVSSSHLTLLA